MSVGGDRVSDVSAPRKPAWKDGSTATCVLAVDNILYIANLGDSRVRGSGAAPGTAALGVAGTRKRALGGAGSGDGLRSFLRGRCWGFCRLHVPGRGLAAAPELFVLWAVLGPGERVRVCACTHTRSAAMGLWVRMSSLCEQLEYSSAACL